MRYCLDPSDSYGNVYAALAFMPFGLFFDFMDGKVARWRGKSSLMGQELDSLADLVCLDNQVHSLLHFLRPDHEKQGPTPSVASGEWIDRPLSKSLLIYCLDILWCRTCSLCLRPWSAHPTGYISPLILCSLRLDSPRSFQRHRFSITQR